MARGGNVDTTQRPLFEAMASAQPLPGDVAVTQRVGGGIPVIDIEIADVHTTDAIGHFHGGGDALGSASASVRLASDLSRRARPERSR